VGGQFASLLVGGARSLADNPTVLLALTVVFAAVALSLLRLAVSVTGSFITGWMIIGPARPGPAGAGRAGVGGGHVRLLLLGAFEVTPPDRARRRRRRGDHRRPHGGDMWQALKYALPAVLAPIAFVLTGPGEYMLGRAPALGVLWIGLVAGLRVAARR
jgi:hypothetical protein